MQAEYENASTSEVVPSQFWNLELLEAMNFLSIQYSKVKSKQFFEIYLFSKFKDSAFLINSRPEYFEDDFIRINPSTPIYLLQDDATTSISAIHPKTRAVSTCLKARVCYKLIYVVLNSAKKCCSLLILMPVMSA